MEIDKLIKTLTQNSRILNHLDESEIMGVLRCCASKSFKDKDQIFKEDSKGAELYILISGSVVVKKGGKTLDVIRSGECFGEMGALSNEKRSASTEADGDVVLLVVDVDKVETLKPEIQVKILKNIVMIISERLRERIEEIVH
jgi:eukaryotic-like serine/threonine-protein kinase